MTEQATAEVREQVPLASYTTLRVGGPARRLAEPATAGDVVAMVAAADRAGEPVLVLGGGSNVVAPDGGFPGTVVRVATRGAEMEPAGERVLVRAQAGEDWEPLAARCVAEGLVGVECLSGIPGLVGATPIQNVGAYGQEISETLVAVRAYDRRVGEVVELPPERCGFGYRTSAFKGNDRHVVLDVTLALRRGSLSAPVRYAQLARSLGVELGQRVPLGDARAAVLELRRGKGMVLDPADGDTASAGSFFTNPVLDGEDLAALRRRVAERLGPEAEPPCYPVGYPVGYSADYPAGYPAGDGRTKVSAAWLIERAGFFKGYTRGRVRISAKHTLALTNPEGRGSAAELLALAREVRDGVRDAFGVELANEPTLLGTSL